VNCPKCNHYCSDIIESRRRAAGTRNARAFYSQHLQDMFKHLNIETVRRRRVCPQCNHRWTTFELPTDALEILRPVNDKDRFLVDAYATMRAFSKAIKELEQGMQEAVTPVEDP